MLLLRSIRPRRSGPAGREPRFRELPRAAQVIVVATVVAALIAAALSGAIGDADVALLATTAVLCLAAGFFEVDGPGSSSLHPGLMFVFWAAMLLPGILLPVLAALCFLPSALRRRARWYMPAFHAAACVLAGLAARPVADAAGAPAGELGGPGVAALVAAALLFVLVVDGLLLALVRATSRRALRRVASELA